MSLERGLRQILRNWGHNILLQRYNMVTKEYSDVLERWTVRHTHRASLPDVAEEHQEGRVHEYDVVYYFEAPAKPKELDRIYETDDRYPDNYSLWLVDVAQPMRGRRGEIVFWTVGVTREEPN